MMTLSRASSKSLGSTSEAPRFAAISAAEFTIAYKSAPEKPGVAAASKSTSTSTQRMNDRSVPQTRASSRCFAPRAAQQHDHTFRRDDLGHVQVKNVSATHTIREADLNLRVEATRPGQRRVKDIHRVGSSCGHAMQCNTRRTAKSTKRFARAGSVSCGICSAYQSRSRPRSWRTRPLRRAAD